MFISGGKGKGRKIKAPSAKDIRPTSQMIKGALFDILRDEVQEASFLDLFAGFGTIGIEAMSRGAECCFFIDKNNYALSTVHENLTSSGYRDKCTLILSDAVNALQKRIKRQFDIVYIDPPYDYLKYVEVLSELSEKNILSSKGIAVVEHYHKTILPESLPGIILYRKEKYGQTALTFFQRVYK